MRNPEIAAQAVLGEDVVGRLVGGGSFDAVHARAALVQPFRGLDGQAGVAPDDLLAVAPVARVEAGAEQDDVTVDLDAALVLGRLHVLGGDVFQIADLAQVPYRTGAATRNWDSYGAEVALAAGVSDWQRDLLCDPQTSGGLLVAVSSDAGDDVLAAIRDAGFAGAAAIGALEAGRPEIRVA